MGIWLLDIQGVLQKHPYLMLLRYLLLVLRIYNTFVDLLQILCDLSADQLAMSHRLIVFQDNKKLLHLLLTSSRQWIVCQYVAHIKQKKITINNRLTVSSPSPSQLTSGSSSTVQTKGIIIFPLKRNSNFRRKMYYWFASVFLNK